MGQDSQADNGGLLFSSIDGSLEAPNFSQVTILGSRFHLLSVGDLLGYIIDSASRFERRLIANVNVKALNLGYQYPWFRAFLNRADLVFCDGVGVLLGARFLGNHVCLRHRMTCPDFLEALALLCAQDGLSIYLLAGKPGVAEQAATKLTNSIPELRIRAHHGYFDKNGPENIEILQELAALSPDILMIGFGMPLQERWLLENLKDVSARVIVIIGGCLDVYTEQLYRLPKWMTDHGLEWLGRLATEEPARVWHRYLIGNPLFLWRVLKQRFGLLRLPEDG